MAGAVMLRRGVTGAGVGAQFLRQLALVACFAGQMLFIGGVGATTNSTEAAAVAALIASAVLIAVYPDRVQRFCSAVIAAGALWSSSRICRTAPTRWRCCSWRRCSTSDASRRERRRTMRAEIVEPVMYGLAIALFALLIVSTAITMFGVARTSRKCARC